MIELCTCLKYIFTRLLVTSNSKEPVWYIRTTIKRMNSLGDLQLSMQVYRMTVSILTWNILAPE